MGGCRGGAVSGGGWGEGDGDQRERKSGPKRRDAEMRDSEIGRPGGRGCRLLSEEERRS